MQLGDDLTHGGHTALALQTLRYNGITSIREINWSFGVKDSEQGGRWPWGGHQGPERLHKPPLPWFVSEGV